MTVRKFEMRRRPLQSRKRFGGPGQSSINGIVKKINKSKPLLIKPDVLETPNGVRMDGNAFPFFAAEPRTQGRHLRGAADRDKHRAVGRSRLLVLDTRL